MSNKKLEFKSVYIVAIGMIALLAVLLTCFFIKKQDASLRFSLRIKSENQTSIISLSKENGNWTFYLPSFADSNNVFAVTESKDKILLDGKSITDGDNVGWICPGLHKLEINNKVYDINVCKSSNVATLFINLYRGKIEDLYQDKNTKTKAAVRFIESDGTIDCCDDKVQISGRGNSTWQREKKPFNLNFDKEVSILGMSATNKWAILANAYDPSGLRDVLMKRFAGFLGMAYPIETDYVDVYIDGKYNGLYVLSKKPDVDDEYMARIDYPERLTNPIPFNDISSIEIRKYPSDAGIEYRPSAEKTMNAVREFIYSDSKENPLDMESWAKAYLVDEILANIDAGRASSYMHWNDGGKVYKGPIWDGDLTLGSSDSFPIRVDSLVAYGLGSCWKYLAEKDEFVNEVNRIYFDRRTEMEDYLIKEIDNLNSKICIARNMDGIRWKNMYDSHQSLMDEIIMDPGKLQSYIHDRLVYLDDVIKNPSENATILIMVDYLHYVCTIPKGEVFTVPNEVANLYDSDVWMDTNTGTQVDLSIPLQEDLEIINMEDYDLYHGTSTSPLWLVHMSVFLIFVALFVGVIVLDKRKNR